MSFQDQIDLELSRIAAIGPTNEPLTAEHASGTTYDGKQHRITDNLGLTIGEPLAGPMFPVLARR